jgi:hypothetical protein
MDRYAFQRQRNVLTTMVYRPDTSKTLRQPGFPWILLIDVCVPRVIVNEMPSVRRVG